MNTHQRHSPVDRIHVIRLDDVWWMKGWCNLRDKLAWEIRSTQKFITHSVRERRCPIRGLELDIGALSVTHVSLIKRLYCQTSQLSKHT